MTQLAIKQQIKDQISALQKTTANAIKSKASANQYLIDAGIIVKVVKQEKKKK